jgi:hypothetical protein
MHLEELTLASGPVMVHLSSYRWPRAKGLRMFGTQGIWSAAWGLVLGACVGEWADGSGAAALQGAAASAPEPAGWTGPGGDVTTFLPHGVLARNLSRGVEGRWVGGVATLRPLGSVEGVDVSLSGFGRPGDMRPVIEGMASAGPCQSDGALDADGGVLAAGGDLARARGGVVGEPRRWP